jgi:hypothetical protein
MSGLGADMSGNRIWNPAWGLDMSGPRDLTRDKAERPDMSRITLWNLDKEPDTNGWDLASEELGLGRTCPARVTGTRIRS